MGAHETLQVGKGDPKDLAKQVENKLGKQPDIVIECCGAEPSIRLGIFVS